jgi:hypothetical protein
MKKTFLKLLPLVLLAFVVAVPLVVSAQGLIVCEDECTFRDLFKLANRINDFLLNDVMIPLAAFSFGVAGVYFIWGGADPGKLGTAKSIFSNTFIGILIAVSAWLIINTLLSFLVDGKFNLLGPAV